MSARSRKDKRKTSHKSEQAEPKPDPVRSALMARIGPKDTTPELVIRKLLYKLGYRYRLHSRGLPGTPDICFPGRRKVIFIHGCFWHRHKRCARTTTPKTRREFWNEKFRANISRDRRNVRALKKLGWEVLVIWECESRRLETLPDKLIEFLG